MEGIEETNKAAIENCYNVLSFITQPQEKKNDFRYLAVETEKAVSKFKKVVSNLGNGVGHARARILKQNRTSPLLQGAFLETRNDPKVEQKQPVNQGFQLFKTNLNEGCVHENGSTTGKSCLSLGNSSLELSLSSGKTPVSVGHHPKANTHYHFLQQQQQMKYQAEMMHKRGNIGVNMKFDNPSCTPTASSTRSFISSLSVDGNVANLGGSGFNLIGGSHASGQNSSQCKKKCTAVGDKSLRCRITGKCHCPKKRKNRVRRSIKVPAVSNKLADIPSDEFSWRKYGQKPIKGSPHPRGYYKCSSVRGCPARKHVERCLDEPSMLIVTYEDEHNHPLVPLQSANP